MAALRAILVILGVLGSGASALADQTDPRLNDLFDDLKRASSYAEAARLEQSIWAIWFETPDQATAALLRTGMEKMARGDLDEALDDFDRVVALAPDFAEGWNRRATVHYLMDELEQSLDDIAATLALEPRHFGALSGRGLVYVKLEDLSHALDSFEAALAVNPQMPGPRVNAEALRRLLKQRDI
jgi:tetratricopeptide (TPR) repeat protein